jgi:hypothetical protein
MSMEDLSDIRKHLRFLKKLKNDLKRYPPKPPLSEHRRKKKKKKNK